MKKVAVRSAIALIALIALVWAMHFFAGPEAPPSQVTRVAGGAGGCQDESYEKFGSDWDLTNVQTRERTNDFGAVELYRHASKHDVWCVKTASGSENRNKPKFMSVRAGYYDPDDGDLVWPDTDFIKFSDSGSHLVDYAGGVVVVVPEGKCLFVRGKVRWQGHLYQRDIATNNAGCSSSS